MDKKPRVSVIMKCYNHEEFVGAAIESVLNQTYKDFEFLVADNGSTDRSGEIIDSYADRIKIFKMEKNDPHKCEIMLREAALGEYVAIICSDDWWAETKLEKQMAAVDRMPDCEFFFTWAQTTGADLESVIESERFVVYNADKRKWFSQLFESGTCFEASSILSKNNGCYMETFVAYGCKYRQLPDFASYFNMILSRKVYVVEEYLVKRRNHSKNVSVPNVRNVQRNMTEDAHIRRYFLERVSDDIFLESFREYLAKEIDESNPTDIMCNKILYFLEYAKSKWWLGQAALEYCWDHYGDSGVAEMLEYKYGFSWKDLQEIAGKIGIGSSPELVKKINENAGLTNEIRTCISKLVQMIEMKEVRSSILPVVLATMENIFKIKVDCDVDSAINCFKLAMIIDDSDTDEVWMDMKASLVKVLESIK